ncbi:MAG: hypothetical protein GY815_10025 [Gammaproteobacteria bacterium]|nr:hypothetical protein [Gammaproteobacteria bacterium]
MQKPWQIAERQFAPADILSNDQVDEIHRASLQILERTGVHFMGQRARDFLAGQAGVEVDAGSQIVRFDPALVEATIAGAPRAFRIHARNPAHDLIIDDRHLNYANVITPPFVSDLDGGKRNGSHAEMRDLLRLCQGLNALTVDTDSLALDTIHEIGPGGQYFDCDHTIQRYRREHYEPLVSDWESLETWEEKGAQSTGERANGIWKRLMEDYRQPALDPAIRDELVVFFANREEEILV